jgi:hypothetical protein
MRSATKNKIGSDGEYLDWIRTLPCSVPGCRRRNIEAHHAGDHGMSQLPPDRTAIPLCGFVGHHNFGKHSAHVLGRRFWAFHGIDRDDLIAHLNRKYDKLTAGKSKAGQ